MTGNFSWGLAVPFMLAQLAGGIVGAILVWLNYLPLWDETEDQGAILGTFATGPAVRNLAANTMTEVIGTFVLVFGLLAFGANTFTDGLNPIVVGILILAIGLSLGGPTGYAINPARDLGPRIAHQILPIKNKGTSDWGYAFVPIIGTFYRCSIGSRTIHDFTALIDSLIFLNDSDLLDGYRFFFDKFLRLIEFFQRLIEFFQQKWLK